jgi:hypothetical protein
VHLSGKGKSSKTLRKICAGSYRLLLLVCVGVLWVVPSGWGQADYATGTVRGTVFDAQGAVVPRATVTITNPATGAIRSVVTSQEGNYQIPSLNPGRYRVEVQAPGFGKLVADEVEVTVGQTVDYDA